MDWPKQIKKTRITKIRKSENQKIKKSKKNGQNQQNNNNNQKRKRGKIMMEIRMKERRKVKKLGDETSCAEDEYGYPLII